MMIIVVIIVIVMIIETVKVYVFLHCTLADWFASFKTPMSTEEERRKKTEDDKVRSEGAE